MCTRTRKIIIYATLLLLLGVPNAILWSLFVDEFAFENTRVICKNVDVSGAFHLIFLPIGRTRISSPIENPIGTFFSLFEFVFFFVP